MPRRKPKGAQQPTPAKQRQALRAGVSPLKRRHKPFQPDPSLPRCPLTGKVGYRSMERAEEALADVLLHGSPRQVAHRTYHCECGAWHLTSQPRREA